MPINWQVSGHLWQQQWFFLVLSVVVVGRFSDKARIVEESARLGAVVASVARRHDVHPNLLHLWRRQAKRAAGADASFLPITVMAQQPSPPIAGLIDIELAGRVRVRVDAAVDEAALSRVLRVLRAMDR